MKIIETSANQLYRVLETNDAALAHVWYGVEVKRQGAGYADTKKGKGRIVLVRKAGCTVIAEI